MTIWDDRAANPRLPLWIRVHAYAQAHVRPDGHCPLTAEELHRGIDPTLTKGAISRAIAKAIEVGELHPSSSARCLVLTHSKSGAPDFQCPATHRVRSEDVGTAADTGGASNSRGISRPRGAQ